MFTLLLKKVAHTAFTLLIYMDEISICGREIKLLDFILEKSK